MKTKENDPRFSHIKSDPRFKKIVKKKQKVKIDNRFAHMFTSDEFNCVDFLDRRGRKEKVVSKEKLERFYHLEEDKEEDTENIYEETQVTSVVDITAQETQSTSLMDDETDDKEDGEDQTDSSDEEDQTDSSDEDEEEDEDTQINNMDAWDQINQETENIEESTCRLSICNLNWDRMNASDIYVLLDSFLKNKGSIIKVEVFPSQYGEEKMNEEKMKGPDLTPVENDDEEYNEAALRKYQIERLKYYYAIVTTDSSDTADTLYSMLDGVEYQLSSSHLDLRYVPDDMIFSDQNPTSVCSELPNLTTYQPPKFITSALQNSSVKLTWDETNQSRLRMTTRKFDEKELESVDFSAFLASSDSEEEDAGGSIEKYKALLAGGEEEDEIDQEMEITWTTGLEDNDKVIEEADKNEERHGDVTHYKPDEKDDFFATDEVIDKVKEKKRKKKKKTGENEIITKESAELTLLMQDGEGEKKHFNMKKIIKNKQKEDNFTVDLSDDRFSALKTSHLYSIDPTAPEYKETVNTAALRTAQNMAHVDIPINNSTIIQSKDQPIQTLDTNTLVDKIKGKSESFKNKKSMLYPTKNFKEISKMQHKTDLLEPKGKKLKKPKPKESVEFIIPKKLKKKEKKKAAKT